MNGSKIKHGVVVAAAIALLAGAAVATGPAFAAKGGHSANSNGGGHGNHGGSTSAAVLTYAPNPVPVGNTFTVTGAGFSPNSTVVVGFYGSMTGYYLTTDASGAFTFQWPQAQDWCASMLFVAQGADGTSASTYITVVGC